MARIERACEQETDARNLRERILDGLRRVMRVDAYAFVMTDPESEVGVDPLAEVPCLPELPTLIRLKYLTDVNRWTSLTSAAGLREATGDHPDDSLVWRELLRRHDVGDVASAVFRDRFGCWGFLDLWRTGADARFSGSELDLLTRLADPVTRALRRVQARTLLEHPTPRPGTGPVMLLLSPHLEVRGQTPQTLEYLRTLLPSAPDAPPIPAVAYNVAAQLLAVEAGVDAHTPVARVHLTEGRWLTVRADRLAVHEAGAHHPIAVTIETASPSERSDLFARAFGLSPRESELLAHLAAGLDTKETAALMFLSEYTIQDHLKAISAKTGVHTRRTLIGLIMGS
jgi:DNA-binding CsgD family transcriptional regulator